MAFCSFLVLLAAAIITTVVSEGDVGGGDEWAHVAYQNIASRKISVTCDGSQMAIVVPGATSSDKNLVKVFRLNSDEGGSWQQYGSDIVAGSSDDEFGTAISLSNDNRLAIGTVVGGQNQVRLYDGPSVQDEIDADWVSSFDAIPGQLSSINAEGTRVAVAVPDATRVYELDGSSLSQLGGDLPGVGAAGLALDVDATKVFTIQLLTIGPTSVPTAVPTSAPIDIPPVTAEPTSAPAIAAPSEDCTKPGKCGGGGQDPHLQLADGGTADFRGSHMGIYNMVSSRSYSLNVLIREQDFLQSSEGIEFFFPDVMEQGNKMLVHGTFMFETYSTIRTSLGRLLHLRTEATPTAPANVAILQNNVITSKMTGNKQRIIDDVAITTSENLVTISTSEWILRTTVVRGDKAYFLNVKVQRLPTNSTVAPHGVIGQSFDGDGIPVNGAKDTYNSIPGGETTTLAQAEGAIEGVHTDYLMSSPFATDYKFSRFDATEAVVRDVRKLTNVSSASASF